MDGVDAHPDGGDDDEHHGDPGHDLRGLGGLPVLDEVPETFLVAADTARAEDLWGVHLGEERRQQGRTLTTLKTDGRARSRSMIEAVSDVHLHVLGNLLDLPQGAHQLPLVLVLVRRVVHEDKDTIKYSGRGR